MNIKMEGEGGGDLQGARESEMYSSGLDRHRRVAVEQRIRVETRKSDMINRLRVGVP